MIARMPRLPCWPHVRRVRSHAERREEVGDYLLGQRAGVAERLATRTFLEGSAPARAWANALAGELAPIAGSLPEVPAGAVSATATDDATSAPQTGRSQTTAARRSRPSPPSSRTGGALLLAAIVAIVVVVVVLVAGSGGGSSGSSSSSVASTPATSASSSTGSTGTTGTTSSSAAKAKEDKRINLSPPDASSKAAGVAEVLSEGSQYAFYLAAEHLAPSKGKGFFYAVWLYNSPSSHEPLGRSPEVASNGSLQGGALLPKDAGKYHTILLTRETSTQPSKPGPVVLSGSFALH